MLTIQSSDNFNQKEIRELFSSVGWAQNLSDDLLYKAILNSSHFVTARIDGKLVGIARSMDDNIWSANIDCVVVHSKYQNCGIAKSMINELTHQLSHIQFINVAPNSKESFSLYLNNGFELIEESRLFQIDNTKGEQE